MGRKDDLVEGGLVDGAVGEGYVGWTGAGVELGGCGVEGD